MDLWVVADVHNSLLLTSIQSLKCQAGDDKSRISPVTVPYEGDEDTFPRIKERYWVVLLCRKRQLLVAPQQVHPNGATPNPPYTKTAGVDAFDPPTHQPMGPKNGLYGRFNLEDPQATCGPLQGA